MKMRVANKFVLGLMAVMLSGCLEPMMAESDPVDAKVAELVSKMTLEEKVGQMTQLTLETVSSRKDGHVQLNMDKVREALVTRHVGSILNCGGAANTVANWQ